MYWLKSAIFKIISAYRDKSVKNLSRVYVGGGSKEEVMKYGGGAPESLLSMDPRCPCYATGCKFSNLPFELLEIGVIMISHSFLTTRCNADK